MDLTFWIRLFGFIMILLYFICGVDDTIWFLYSMIASIFYHRRNKADELDFNELRNTPPKMLAVSIAAWHEANVIGGVITNFLNTTDYPKSMYHLFVGVYPNDPDTIAAVNEVSKVFPNVHAIINDQNGPTTKAQNINHVIRQIKRFGEANNIRFASLTIHDSEDVIHTYELLATNYLIDSHDALQFPVFPIMEMPRFGNFFRQLTTATYADEFAENHYISLVERRNMNAFVPCAGTGFAISWNRILEFGDEDVLPSESLTEDYLLSLSLYKRGIPLYYVLNKLPRVMNNGKVRTDFITTRSLFPSTFKTAVRQKTRWTYGITMQSVSMKDVFASRGVSFIGRYSFYRDLKAKLVNLVPLLGYAAFIYCILAFFMDLTPLYLKDTPAYYMAMAVFAMMIIRQIFRGYALYHVYGFRSVFFGCLLPPLFPIRLIYGNIINLAATLRAFRMKLFGRRSAMKQGRKEKEKAKKKPVKWAKTDHEFLSRDQLRRYRRMLGDTLITQGYLTAAQFNEALRNVKKDEGEQIGAYLIKNGFITEEQMIMALGHVKHIQFIPDNVLRRLDIDGILNRFDKEKLLEAKLLPLTIEKGTCIVGICNATSNEAVEQFSKENELPVRRMYLMEPMISEKLQLNVTKDKPADKTKKPKPLSSLKSYRLGAISFEQLILIGLYALRLEKPENEIRQYMGI